MVEQVVFTQPLAVIRRHDDQCPIEQAAIQQRQKEHANLIVEITQAVVIRISSELDIARIATPSCRETAIAHTRP